MPRGRPRSTSLPYVPIDPHIDEHTKTQYLVDILSGKSSIPDDYLVEIPQKLIKLAGRRYIDGVLGHLSDRALASACSWDGDAALLRDALVSAGWLNVDSSGNYSLHDWRDYGGMVLARREEDRARKKMHRERINEHRAHSRARKSSQRAGKTEKKRSGIVTRNSGGCPRDVRGLSQDAPREMRKNVSDVTEVSHGTGRFETSKSSCDLAENRSDDDGLGQSVELSRGIPEDVRVMSVYEGEVYIEKSSSSRVRVRARSESGEGNGRPSRHHAAAAGSPSAMGKGVAHSNDDDVSWLLAMASPGLPEPTTAEVAALRELGRVDAAVWSEATQYVQRRAEYGSVRAPWAYAARRAADRAPAIRGPQKRVRSDSVQPAQSSDMTEILKVSSDNGMPVPRGDVLDELLSLHSTDSILDSIALYSKESTDWRQYIREVKEHRRAAAAAAMAEIARLGFAVPTTTGNKT